VIILFETDVCNVAVDLDIFFLYLNVLGESSLSVTSFMRFEDGAVVTRLPSSACLRFNPNVSGLIFNLNSSERLQLYPGFLLFSHIVWTSQDQVVHADLVPVGALKQELAGLWQRL